MKDNKTVNGHSGNTKFGYYYGVSLKSHRKKLSLEQGVQQRSNQKDLFQLEGLSVDMSII